MNKFIALETANNKIAQVDGQLEEDPYPQTSAAISHLNIQDSIKTPLYPQSQPSLPHLQQLSSLSPQLNQTQMGQLSGNEALTPAQTNPKDGDILEFSMEQLSRYFQSSSRVLNEQEKRADYAEAISQKVLKQIKEGILKVNKQSRHLSFRKAPNKLAEQKLRQNIQAKKIDIIQSLRQIEEEQLQLRAKRRTLSHQTRHMHRSEMTEADKQNLLHLIKAKKQFELSIKKKNQGLIEQAKLEKLKEEQRLRKEFQHANQSKKEKILQHLKQLDNKFQERENLLKNSILRKVNTYSYKKKEREWKRSQSLHDLEFKKKLQQLHERHALNIEEINQHEKRYALLLESRALSKSKVKISSQSLPKRQKTQFDRLVEEQLFEMREKNQERVLKIMQREFRGKIASYQQKIDQEHKPKADPAKTIVIPVEKDYSSVSLSKQERFQKGLQYLAKAKQMKKHVSTLDLHRAQTISVQPPEEKGYKNYLKQQVAFDPLEKELTKILSDKSKKSNFESVMRAKFLAEGLQEKGKRAGDKKMYNSMKTKLMLLQNLY